MRFEVLGPLRVAVADAQEPMPVSAGRLRAVLAVLLWRANHSVPVDELSELVWDGAPPAGPAEAMRALVLRLRRVLGPQAKARIVTRTSGYLIEVSDDELDATQFDALCQDTGTAVRAGDWPTVSATAASALELWRGAPLADVGSQGLRDAWLPRLDQQHIQTLEWQAEAELRLGRHEELIPRLRDLAARHPLREHFHAQLMLALCRAGRQVEALAVYRHARRKLVDELGIEPGPDLRRLHEHILAADTDLLVPPPDNPTPRRSPATASVPRQLPAAVPHFTGRQTELDALTDLSAGTAPAVTISAIDGMAGIGKTALAVRWAHTRVERFPDGQLYVNLRGFDPSRAPTAPGEAVYRFLEALGVPPQRIPADPDERAALYRSRLAGRRVLVLLDNARDVEQVRPLLPGSPGCLVLVTSRNQLAELVALDGAVPLTLDLLTHGEARDLLTRRLGRARVLAEEQAIDELITLCARLPLALNIAAANATLHPARSLAGLVDELRDAHRRLSILTIGSGTADVRAVFSWSYHTLAPGTARVFRLLAIHPGPHAGPEAVASLTALDPDRTHDALQALTRAHLIIEQSPGRYTFHDLLRAYAAEQVRIHDNEAEQQVALHRICDFYLHTAHGADRILHTHRPRLRLDPPAPGTHPLHLADMAAALAWFDTERANLLACQHTAASQAWPSVVRQLAWEQSTFRIRRGHRHDELAAWQVALRTAGDSPDPSAHMIIHRLLGRAHADLGRLAEAFEHLYEALAVAERHDELTEQAHTHRTLALAWEREGDARRELHHATRAVALYRAVGQPMWEADARHMVGWCTARIGDFDTARAHCQAALARQRHHLPTSEGDTLNTLGYIEHHTGHHEKAVEHFEQALALRRAIGNTYQCTDTLDQLGHAHAALGRHRPARAAWRQALDLYREQERMEDAERVERQLATLDLLVTADRENDGARTRRLGTDEQQCR